MINKISLTCLAIPKVSDVKLLGIVFLLETVRVKYLHHELNGDRIKSTRLTETLFNLYKA